MKEKPSASGRSPSLLSLEDATTDLLAEVPALGRVATIETRQLFAMDSSDMHPSDWIALARLHELTVAVAGSLRIGDFPIVADAGADIVGVRGAACDTGRDGRVSAARVRALSDALTRGVPAAFP